jgi:hypothetical protein
LLVLIEPTLFAESVGATSIVYYAVFVTLTLTFAARLETRSWAIAPLSRPGSPA